MLGSKLTLAGIAAMIGLSASAAAAPTPTVRSDSAGPVRTGGRNYRRSPVYRRKTPSTPADFEALAKAEAKRQRKAAKLMRHGL